MALQRAQRFVILYLAQLAGAVDLTVLRQRLDEVITTLTGHAFDQDANNRSAKAETEKQQQIRLTLRTQQMQPIAEIARRNLRTAPEFKALQMPPRQLKGGAFLASAQAMAAAASTNKAALLARGLPSDFLDQFQAALTKLEDSIGAREDNHTHRKGATKGLLFAEQEGRSVLKVLDASVRRALAGHDTLLATWHEVRTIAQRPPTVAPAPTPAPTGSTTPESTTATAPASSTPAQPAG
jgi:hypothetical protein